MDTGQAARAEPFVAAVDDSTLGALVRFQRRAWDPAATIEGARRARHREAQGNPAAGGDSPPTFLFMDGEDALGHVTTIPASFTMGGAVEVGSWIKGLWVLPEAQKGPVGPLLIKAVVARLGGPLAAIAAAPEAVRVFEAFGLSDLGPLSNRLKILRADAMVRRLHASGRFPPALQRGLAVPLAKKALALGLSAGDRVRRAVRSTSTTGRRVRRGWEAFSEVEVDSVWDAGGARHGFAVCRDGAYLRWRYRDMMDGVYQFVGAWHGDTLGAWAVFRRPLGDGNEGLGGARLAVLSDFYLAPGRERCLAAALEEGARLCFDWGAEGIFASHCDPGAARSLARSGYVGGPDNVRFLLKHENVPPSLGSCWITRGDGYADFDV